MIIIIITTSIINIYVNVNIFPSSLKKITKNNTSVIDKSQEFLQKFFFPLLTRLPKEMWKFVSLIKPTTSSISLKGWSSWGLTVEPRVSPREHQMVPQCKQRGSAVAIGGYMLPGFWKRTFAMWTASPLVTERCLNHP